MKAIIDITGAGPHNIVTASAGDIPVIQSIFLTFAHVGPKALKVTMRTGSKVVAGPFYVLDGQVWEWSRAGGNMFALNPGESFSIEMDSGLSAAGEIEYSANTPWLAGGSNTAVAAVVVPDRMDCLQP
jgi:hypothetical protein